SPSARRTSETACLTEAGERCSTPQTRSSSSSWVRMRGAAATSTSSILNACGRTRTSSPSGPVSRPASQSSTKSPKPSRILSLLPACTAVAVSAQEPGDLFFQKTLVGSKELIQRTTVLTFAAPPPSQTVQQATVDAATNWLVSHGYLTSADAQGSGPKVTFSGSSIIIVFHVPGGPDVVIVLPNGPFL